MEEIKLFSEAPIKYMKEYHLIVKNQSFEPETQEINYDYREYHEKPDKSNSEIILQLHQKFNYLKHEIIFLIKNYKIITRNFLKMDYNDISIEELKIQDTLYDFLNTYELHHFYVSFVSEKLNEFKDIDNILKNEWDELKTKIINYTNVHTFSCLIMSCYDLFNKKKINKNFEIEFSDYDKNILLWAFLLHDIGKYITFDSIGQDFYDYMPADKVHPYKSGVISVRIFYRNKFLKVNEKFNQESLEKDIELLCYYLSHSYRTAKYNYSDNEVREMVKQTFLYLDQIYESLERIRLYHIDNNWIVDVLLLIIFHQSLPNVDNPRFLHDPIMDDFNIKRFFKSRRLLELMRFIMINDSAGHTIFGMKINLCSEINEKLDSLRNLFDY